MSTEYTIVIEKDEDGYYVANVPVLPGCHTQGTSMDQLLGRMQEAIKLWLEVEGDRRGCLPITRKGPIVAP